MENFFAELESPAPVETPENEQSPEMAGEDVMPPMGENVDAAGADEDAVAMDEDETVEMEEFGNYGATFSIMEFVKRLLKYLVEGLVVAIAASTIPKKSLDV
jgi:hypothetical protein